MAKTSKHGGQTPWRGLGPKPPELFPQWPFYYASLQCNWMYWYCDIETARPYVERLSGYDTGLKVARFKTSDDPKDDKAVVLLNFQRYTGNYDTMLSTCNEVEFNIVAYAANRSPGVPYMTAEEWLDGQDQTKTLGHLRVHVAADNAFAVKAGRETFGEPKFVGEFNYNVPSLNAPPSRQWNVQLLNPDDKNQFVYDMKADLDGVQFWPANCSPVPEFACGLGRTVWTCWTIIGQFNTAMLTKEQAKKTKLKIGDNDFPMSRDMMTLIGEKNRPFAAQTFSSLPACAEPEGFWVDGIDRDDAYG